MMKSILSDFSRVILFPADSQYQSGLNDLHKKLSQQQEYSLLDNFKINTELLEYYSSLKDKVTLYIFTSETIQEAPEFQKFLQPVFKEIFSAVRMGISKQSPESYSHIAEEIGLKPEEILFIDDSEGNVEAAKQSGMKGIVYENNEQVMKEVSTLF